MMDFLNNIWLSISTPNEQLIKIISAPLAFFEICLSFYLINSLLNLNVNKREKYSYIISATVVSIISLFFFETPFNVVFNYISLFIIVHFTLKTNPLKTFIAAVFPTIVFTIVETFIFKPYISLFHITYD